MDALEVLKSDHDKARNLFMQFRAANEAGDTAKMDTVAAEIFDELDMHTAIEERVFYPAVEKAGGSELEDITAESDQEHHVVDLLMAELRELTADAEEFAPKMTVLIENVEHHAGEEEEEMFPMVRNLFSQEELDALGADLQREKHAVRVERMTIDELRDAAARLDIDGRSSMDRSDLAAAVLGTLTGGAA